MKADFVRLPDNVPVEVALKTLWPIACQSRFGNPLALFITTDGRRLFLPLVASNRIAVSGIRAGELFTICRRREHGQVTWLIDRHAQSVLPGTSRVQDCVAGAVRAAAAAQIDGIRFSAHDVVRLAVAMLRRAA